jgi:hypothetical protein
MILNIGGSSNVNMLFTIFINNVLVKELRNNTVIDNKLYYKNLKKEKFLNQVKFTEKVYSSKKEFQEIII